MRAIQTSIAALVACLVLGPGACTVYVVPAEEAEASGEAVAEAGEAPTGGEDTGEVEDGTDDGEASPPPERSVRRREGSEAEDSAAAAAREAEARDEAERRAEAQRRAEARAEAERRAREDAEREAAERRARLEAEEEARLAAERRAREAAERRARREAEREARLAAEEAAARAAREEEARRRAQLEAREGLARARAGARDLHVPPGHHPPEGQCRVWYEGRPPGRQPEPAPCEALLDGTLEPGVFILYGGESWYGNHDWEAVALEYPGIIPRPVVAVTRVVAEGDQPTETPPERGSGAPGEPSVSDAPPDRSGDSPRRIEVPRGALPAAGACRIWYEGRPPGRQPDAAPCGDLPTGELEEGAFILFGDEAWDAEYDWEAEEERRPGSVPPEVLAILTGKERADIGGAATSSGDRGGPRGRGGRARPR